MEQNSKHMVTKAMKKYFDTGDEELYAVVELLRSRLKNPDRPSDVFATFMYAVMLESNFYPLVVPKEECVEGEEAAEPPPDEMPAEWTESSPESYVCAFSPLEHPCRCQVAVRNLADATAAVNVLCEPSANVYTVALPLADFAPPLSADVLNTARRLVKDAAVSPAKADLFASVGFSGCNLNALPVEILHEIFAIVGAVQTTRLSATCRRLRTYAFYSPLWRYFFKKDFPADYANLDRERLEDANWYEMYQESHKRKHNISRPYIQRCRLPNEIFTFMYPFRPNPSSQLTVFMPRLL